MPHLRSEEAVQVHASILQPLDLSVEYKMEELVDRVEKFVGIE